ncbi:hypothetical protein L6164_020339 [Bauhinia variegata]|nr:hypothetical protein L6164_020339 [Bauhinia variegata]
MESDYSGSACCFCFSIKKSEVKKRSSSGDPSPEHTEWGKNDEILTDTSTFSVKEQERRLKKALEEEDRVSREAERVIQWVKQESARMDVSSIKTMLSDDENKEPSTK